MTMARQNFSGTITHREQVLPLDFDVWADEQGHLSVELHPLDVKTFFILRRTVGGLGETSDSLVLEGRCKSGTTFFSDTIEVTGFNMSTQGNTIALEAREALLKGMLNRSRPRPCMRLWFRGFKSLRTPPVSISMGRITVGGPATIAHQDQMAGFVALEAETEVDGETWLQRADAYLTFLHQGLSFGHGGRLQTPRLDLAIDDRWEARFYAGTGYPRNLAPIPAHDQGPFIAALARRLDSAKPFPEMLWTAVGWLHDDSSFEEARFLMAMTALETIVEHVIPKTLTTVMDKAKFAVLRNTLLTALHANDMEATAAAIFENKIKGLNSRSLSQKLQALRDHYNLPPTVFSDAQLIALTKVRNDLVHTGGSAKADLLQQEILVRELIALIVLRELEYQGPYESYIGGHRQAELRGKAVMETRLKANPPEPT